MFVIVLLYNYYIPKNIHGAAAVIYRNHVPNMHIKFLKLCHIIVYIPVMFIDIQVHTYALQIHILSNANNSDTVHTFSLNNNMLSPLQQFCIVLY